jgi:hypothetical protein
MDFDLVSGKLLMSGVDSGEVKVIEYGSTSEVIEKTYFEEINRFVDVLNGVKEWPHSYRCSAVATATLGAMEKSASDRICVEIDPSAQPLSLN